MALVNGKLDTRLLVAIDSVPRYLDVLAAAAWRKVVAGVKDRYGWTPTLTDGATAYRSYDQQVDIFTANYTTAPNGMDRKYWPADGRWWYRRPGRATAAVPGTSNHGWAKAVDVSGLGGFDGTRYSQFRTVALKHGFTNTEGASIGEYWHWVYDESQDTTKDTTEEEDDMPLSDTDINKIVAALKKDIVPDVLDGILNYKSTPDRPELYKNWYWTKDGVDAMRQDVTWIKKRIGGSAEDGNATLTQRLITIEGAQK